MQIKPFLDSTSNTITYVVYDEATADAVVFDPVLDFDAAAVDTRTDSVEALAAFLDAEGLKLGAIIETHPHADHVSGAQWLKSRYGAPIVISSGIRTAQATFKEVLNLEEDFAVDGSQFDRLVDDGEELAVGSLRFKVIHTPGHTPSCASYLIDDALFTGDALFMPDFGTGRCDFPNGSAELLYDSVVHKLYSLPDETRVFVGHDYGPGGRELAWETTIGASKRENKQLKADTEREEFVQWRTARDATLNAPRLLFQAVQLNLRAGAMPPAEENGRAYLKLPIGLFS